jgi:hypothetical protein
LHIAWVSLGFDPERFWQITLREVDREMRGARKRLEREADERMSLAWHIVALDRTKKLPKLETLLIGNKGTRNSRRQTPEEHLVAMKSIFLAFGGNPEELKTLQ